MRRPAAGRGPSFDLAGVTPFRVSVLANRLTLWAARVYNREFGVGVLEWRVMAALAELGPATASEVAALTVLDKSNVSRTAGQLLARGLVERSGHPGDGRKRILALTGEGRALHARVAGRSRGRERRLFEGWSAAERSAFLTLLARFDARAAELLDETEAP